MMNNSFLRSLPGLFGGMLMIMLLVACSEAEEKKNPSPTATEISLPTEETIPLQKRVLYENQYERLRQLHESMAGIWNALQAGGNAQCELYDDISPGEFSEDDDISRYLKNAAIELEKARQLWEAECQNPREIVPPDVIDEGVRMVRTAGDALAIVNEMLSNMAEN